MALKWNNPRQLDDDFARFQEAYDKAAIEEMFKIGEELVKYARLDSSKLKHYTDRTGNLRNSIGYIVVFNEQVIGASFVGDTPSDQMYADKADADMAHRKGLEYATSIGRQLKGYKTYLVLVAGMEYAVYVQAKGFDVLAGAEAKLEADKDSYMEEFKRHILYLLNQ